ncbi:MAG: phosphoribosylaminoimidazolesuccinocarboxamide synthase, partial [Bacteroidota bacterium]
GGGKRKEGRREKETSKEHISTTTTKAHVGNDEDISRDEILKRGIVSASDYEQLEHKALTLFRRGTEIAASHGLILVDTKYEFGKNGDRILLIDEVHTPDSSRYFYQEGYAERQQQGEAQKQLSKEFVRQWLIENGFQGKEGQHVPEMTDAIVEGISARYRELYAAVTGKDLESLPSIDLETRIRTAIEQHLG